LVCQAVVEEAALELTPEVTKQFLERFRNL
jgi:hypothetical protein